MLAHQGGQSSLSKCGTTTVRYSITGPSGAATGADLWLELCWDQVGLIRHTLQVISGMKNEVMGTGAEPWQQSENGMCMN